MHPCGKFFSGSLINCGVGAVREPPLSFFQRIFYILILNGHVCRTDAPAGRLYGKNINHVNHVNHVNLRDY